MRDCEQLSSNAQKIFEKLKPFFPPDPWKRPQLVSEGRVYDNGWFDLRRSADRKKLEEQKKSLLGYLVHMEALMYREKNRSLEGFTKEHFPEIIKTHVEILLLLSDLDFQIETADLCDE